MKSIFEYTIREGLVVTNTTMLISKTMIDEDEDVYDMIDNGIGNYDNSFQPGSFGGSSQVGVSLSQTRLDLENVVDDTLVATGTFYKQALPLFQEIMNSCSTKVQKDECMEITRNQNMKHIDAKGIHS